MGWATQVQEVAGADTQCLIRLAGMLAKPGPAPRIISLKNVPHARELFVLQGFRKNYIIDRTADGRMLAVPLAIRMVSNSASPPPLIALASVNLSPSQPTLAMAA